MIKRIIFDLDNTIIDWKEEYWNSINITLNKCNIKYNKNDILNFIKAIDNYENEYDLYKKEYMVECINKYANLQINIKFIDMWIEELSKCVPEKIEKEIIETLEYLNKKYELVILTNWFKKSQYERLKNSHILKYFKEIYAPETYKIKPNTEAFKIASNEKIEECIMIGDSFKVDIEGAINSGMKAIFYDRKNIKTEYKNIRVITEFKQLQKVL